LKFVFTKMKRDYLLKAWGEKPWNTINQTAPTTGRCWGAYNKWKEHVVPTNLETIFPFSLLVQGVGKVHHCKETGSREKGYGRKKKTNVNKISYMPTLWTYTLMNTIRSWKKLPHWLLVCSPEEYIWNISRDHVYITMLYYLFIFI
jgi:hypothetical protein